MSSSGVMVQLMPLPCLNAVQDCINYNVCIMGWREGHKSLSRLTLMLINCVSGVMGESAGLDLKVWP